MKWITFALMSSVLAMVPYSGAAGKGQDTEISVTAQHRALTDWTARTGQMLSQKLQYPTFLGDVREGVVAVKFRCSDTGVPTDVALLKSSGSVQLDRAAMRGVSKIKTLHPLPSGLAPSQKYVATVLFARSEDSYVRQIRKLESDQRDGNKWFDGGNRTLAINLLDDNDRIVALN
ncbi:energy transducer TonB family protein [Sphingobium lactosutens]|uniref:energy transducer TonB family protein n=1 Tax=Sphingobium lactosutens TaxID=522773 RepID=UPI0015C0E823|nr:energy transducer TonB [Sphingobium lactosutens]